MSSSRSLEFNSLLGYFPSRWLFSFSYQYTFLALLIVFSYLYFDHILYRSTLHLFRILWGAEQRGLLTTKITALNKCPLNFKSINCFVNPSDGQSVSQSVSQLVCQSVSQSGSQAVRRSDSWSVGQSIDRSIGWSVSLSVSQSVDLLVSQSLTHSGSHSGSPSVSQSIGHQHRVSVQRFETYYMKNSISYRESIVWNLLKPSAVSTRNYV